MLCALSCPFTCFKYSNVEKTNRHNCLGFKLNLKIMKWDLKLELNMVKVSLPFSVVCPSQSTNEDQTKCKIQRANGRKQKSLAGDNHG
uniref:Putative ovule protein n=1 Tax=Solanum chacoense TaxID=4108 RepID=A0A0V0GQ47_SOLCH